VYLAYVDDSGDDGPHGSRSYVLACVMVQGDQWQAAFDQVLGFRRWVKAHFGIPVREEIKANYLLRNGGPALRAHPLSESARRDLFRAHLRLQSKVGLSTFAVVVDKARVASLGGSRRLASDIAWEYLLQRLERRATKEGTQILLSHDQGDDLEIRRRARKARRAGSAGSAFGTGSLSVPFIRLLDDPVPKDSRQSYFIQLADLAAYAAYRRMYPPPARAVQVVPQSAWDELGAARFAPVRSARFGDPTGIVPGP
jgi:hypothetical protein